MLGCRVASGGALTAGQPIDGLYIDANSVRSIQVPTRTRLGSKGDSGVGKQPFANLVGWLQRGGGEGLGLLKPQLQDLKKRRVLSVGCKPNYKAKTGSQHMWAMVAKELAATGWLGGFGNPPPPPPRLAGWLARPRKTAKIRSAPLYCLFSRMVWVWGWVCKGGGVGHLSRTPLPHTPSCLPFGTSHKDQKHKT